MKTICLTLALLLLTVFHSYAAPHGMEASPTSCCFQFATMRVPLNKIVSIKKTDNNCLLPALIVTTVRDRVICYELTEPWVQKAMHQLKSATHPTAVSRSRSQWG
ncbi:C-C motif chemokine 22 precursor [Esox lucius]|nr:C-C motif chemokine 22 precursor [Esox lucius]ACO13206.1 C-C motif chemokine 4 precursor [Esox lucius]